MIEKNDQHRWGCKERFIQRWCVLIILLGFMMIISLPVTAATTSIHIVRYANDGTTILNETTKTYQWLESNLPVIGDGITHYYSQGPTFNDSDLWDNAEWQNVDTRDWGAVKGTDLKNICNLVGGMSAGETVKIKASDGFSKTFPYEFIYTPNSRQGPMGITWYRADQGYVSSYIDGMRLVMFANAKTNTYGWNTSGWHVFGNADMRDCWEPIYWYNYSGIWPSSGGVSVKTVSEIIIYSDDLPPAPLTVISPNGGESWQRGTSHKVTWSYTGSPGSTVKITLLKAGAEVGTIITSTSIGSSGTGSYTWPISTTGGTGSDYKVSVQSISQPTIKDSSNNVFTLSPPGTTPPTITVTSPNGGESWQRGTSHKVTWSYTGSPGSTVKITLLKAGAEVGTIITSTSIGSSGTGSYTWPISTTGGTGSDYKVSVQSISQPTIKDSSNNVFTLSPQEQPLPQLQSRHRMAGNPGNGVLPIKSRGVTRAVPGRQ